MDSWTLWSEQRPTDAKIVYPGVSPHRRFWGWLCSRNGRIKSFPPYANLIFIVRVVRNGTGGNGIYPKD